MKEPDAHERQMLISLYSSGRYAETHALAQMMTSRFPKHGLAWKVMGAVLKQMGKTAESLGPMQKAVVLMPKDYEAYNNLGVTLKDLGRVDNAISCYRQALALNAEYPEAYSNLGDALRSQGKLAEALICYQQKIKLTPDDGESQHHLSALTGQTTERAPVQYVEKVFDKYANTFDNHLQKTLQYNVPERLVDLVYQQGNRIDGGCRALDLGCGTGLVGSVLSKFTHQITGVDLSNNMLEMARSKNIYQRLVRQDLLEMVKTEPGQSFDLIFSADVFIYIGMLDKIIPEIKRVLSPGGLFAFSVEALNPEVQGNYHLEKSGRYTHGHSYLNQLAATNHFEVVEQVPAQIRAENRQPISGFLSVWKA